MKVQQRIGLWTVAMTWLVVASPAVTQAYVDAPPATFGRICDWSTHAMQVQVESVDPQHAIVVWRKFRELKGRWPGTALITQNLTDLPPTAQAAILKWCAPGKTTLMVALESYKWGHTYIDNVWYASHTEDWKLFRANRLEPLMLRSYCGRTDKLQTAMAAMIAGREVVVPCLADGPLQALLDHSTRVQSLRASLKLLDYKPERDFVHWGAEEFTPLRGITPFNRICTLPRVADARAISTMDFDGDGKMDIFLLGGDRMALLQNSGDSFMELPIVGLNTGARAACWADFDGDGRPDLFVATPGGPRLYHNRGGGDFEDVSPLLPAVPYWGITAATWIDYDGDGKPDLLIADRYRGLHLYRNLVDAAPAGPGTVDRFKDYVVPFVDKSAPPPPPAPKVAKAPPPAMFGDVSLAVGLGEAGLCGTDPGGESLTVADVNGDGRPDVLYGVREGVLLFNTPRGFEASPSGISFNPARVSPVFADFDNSGKTGLFVPQLDGHCKLFRNDGRGNFTDATALAGDVSKSLGTATSAAFGDFDGTGRLDLFVGCLNGPNRLLRNDGSGRFTDITIESGLFKRIFNTQAVSILDVNQDGALDVVLNNEGQESVVLLGNSEKGPRERTSVTVTVAPGFFGGRLTVRDAAGRTVSFREVAAGQARGGQTPPQAHFSLVPGSYVVEQRSTAGQVVTRPFEVGRMPVAVMPQK